jgi:hypothetical protein
MDRPNYHPIGFLYTSLGKLFVLVLKSKVMWLREVTDFLIGNANEVCFTGALFVSLLFFRQYKKYEAQLEKEEMLEKFLHQ